MKYVAIFFSWLLLLSLLPHNVIAQSDEAEIHFIDVGQADCILVIHGDKSMLIDAGDNRDGDTVTKYIKKLGIEDLDYVVATHPHHDHIGGMDEVLKAFEVGKIIMPNVSYPTGHYKALNRVIKKKEIRVLYAQEGKKIKFGNINIQILSPQKRAEYEDFNDYSAVLRLRHNQNTFLLMGDAGVEVEKNMISSIKKKHLASDVLKLGHHGADSATSEQFLKAVSPQAAVISVGRNNRYHFPNDSVLQRLKSQNIPILRTDQIGTLIAKSDGKHIVFHTENSFISQNKEK
ncbi:ComEC/Rec2 family competence protein [Guptibacillus hwajinpoensis]|uniref:Competence protein ComEC n=1 Tax=Guptibacillus hwajinpoensis TaxID=208199 RepID=A0ABU0K9D1_9BACL|nr:MBL fold metallo-hydrolase [Alkalihalobacillus hemicentroti]MDQ0484722.1 competence protein ComEC [Alkalihalobacillus hemicentroti]